MIKALRTDIIKYFLLVLFLVYFGSITLFNHIHIADGVTIVHSHPYKSGLDGIPTHSHLPSGYLLIHLLMNFMATAIYSFAAINIFLVNPGNFIFRTSVRFLNDLHPNLNPLRGPPSVSFI